MKVLKDEEAVVKHYDESCQPICPNCEEKLEEDGIGVWCCVSCSYFEENNLCNCEGEYCTNIVCSSTTEFDNLEDRLCDVKDKHGHSCLTVARGDRGDGDYHAEEIDR